MNNHRVLGVPCKERGLESNGFDDARRRDFILDMRTSSSSAMAKGYFSTTIVPVIFG